jgi:hypothetical protein
MLTLLNIPTPFLASINATSCGVETITAPEISFEHMLDGPTDRPHRLIDPG